MSPFWGAAIDRNRCDVAMVMDPCLGREAPRGAVGRSLAVTATDLRELVADGGAAEGDGIASVDCAWRTRSMSGGMRIEWGGESKFVSLGSTIVLGETSLGGVSLDASRLPDSYGSSPEDPCVYSPIEVDEATNTIWGEFSCGILAAFNENDRCVLGPSYFYFENCPDQ